MKLIEANKNPFFCVLTILEACRERAAFHEDELHLVGEVYATMQFLGQMLESDAEAEYSTDEVEAECSTDCDCERQLEVCDGDCQPDAAQQQLELPL
jgi:hypothetical protein